MKSIFPVAIIAISFFGCIKQSSTTTCTNQTAASERTQLVAFCAANSITYSEDTNGIFYQIIDPGSGSVPTIDSIVTITYTAKFLDGTVLVDKTTYPETDYLKNFLEGLRIAIPYIKESGHIKIVIPSSLLFGCTGYPGVVPPNTPLYYDLVLTDVK